MPDGTMPSTVDTAEDAAVTGDERLVAGVGRRLVLWAAGTTLLVLVVLGIALYAAVDRSLSSSGVRQLEARAAAMRRAIEGPGGRPDGDDLPTGIVFGGGTSGTFALVLGADGKIIVPRNVLPPMNQADLDSLKAAQASGRDVREGSVSGTPVRILTTPVTTQIGIVYVQIFQDRTAEERTLAVLLAVLLVGGVVVLLVASGVGTVYSRRALVPIRASLATQRQALRRQREFAADASHELRTPLTVVRASVDLLRRHPDAPVSEVGDALNDIDAEVDNLTRLVEDLLLLARTDSGAVPLEKLPIDLGDVAAEASSSLVAAAAERGVRISTEPAPVMVRGDAVRLRQLVLILVDNAMRHSPDGGSVEVRARQAANGVEIAVSDDGPGIPAEEAGRVFERFYRADAARAASDGGAGLGLAIAQWIVELHGGQIRPEPRLPRGCRMVVVIPRR